MAQGRFITLEGGEGAGKSTQIARLRDWLKGRGVDVLVTREPGGTPGAEAIRDVILHSPAPLTPMAQALLHFAARADHVDQVIKPALRAGQWVLCDRFADSTRVYQGVAQGLGLEAVDRLYAASLGDFTPDLTLILDLPVEVGLLRAAGRGEGADRYEAEDVSFHQKLRQGFLDIAGSQRDRCVVADAAASEDDVTMVLQALISERLGL